MDNKDSSPLDTLRQLKEWLDAGTITPQEFETLKRKLLFDETPPAGPPAPTLVPPKDPVAVPQPTFPPAPEPHFTASPVNDPLLPPIVDEPLRPPLEPVLMQPGTFRPTENSLENVGDSDDELDGPSEPPRKQPLAMVLMIGGAVLLLALIAYLMLGNRTSERLTSSSLSEADTTAVRIEEGPQAEQLELPLPVAPETIRVQPAVPVAAAPADTAKATSPDASAAPTPVPTAEPIPTEGSVRTQVQRTLTALYADMTAAPFNASQHFAPQVERFYTLQNTTPTAIEEELNRSHFPEFTESQISFDPSSLQVSPVTNDGSVTATYQERGRSFRKSRNQYQQTLAQVRARIDRTGKITYFRQERLLENSFTDPKPAAAPETPPQE